jgi:hypothetical protein
MKPLRVTGILKAGTFAPVVDTLIMPDFNKKALLNNRCYEIPGTDHIAGQRVQGVHIQITFDVYATEEEAQYIADALRGKKNHRFTVEETP